jgi:hypothetical protein
MLAGDKSLKNIHEWLSPPNPWENFKVAHESRHPETGAWFVNSNTFSDWKHLGPSSLLWINGNCQLSTGTYIFSETDAILQL